MFQYSLVNLWVSYPEIVVIVDTSASMFQHSLVNLWVSYITMPAPIALQVKFQHSLVNLWVSYV